MRKTLIAALFAATALPTLALAMPDGPRHGPADRGAPGIFRDLDLSREQQREVGKLFGEQMKKRHAITQKYLDKLPAAEQKAMQAEIQASEEQTRKDVRAKLTAEQQKRFDELQKNKEQRRAERAEFQAWKAEKAKSN